MLLIRVFVPQKAATVFCLCLCALIECIELLKFVANSCQPPSSPTPHKQQLAKKFSAFLRFCDMANKQKQAKIEKTRNREEWEKNVDNRLHWAMFKFFNGG